MKTSRIPLSAAALLALALAGGLLLYQTVARDRDYRALLARGDAALRNDETFVAIEAYSGAIALRHDSTIAHLRRGETYQRRGDRGDLDQAARDFRTAASLDRALREAGFSHIDVWEHGPSLRAVAACRPVGVNRAPRTDPGDYRRYLEAAIAAAPPSPFSVGMAYRLLRHAAAKSPGQAVNRLSCGSRARPRLPGSVCTAARIAASFSSVVTTSL